MLFETGWRLIAASENIWADQNISAAEHLGKSLWDYPFIRPALPALDSFGLFECRARGLKLSIEMTYAGTASRRDMNLWPVMIEDSTVLVHVMAYTQVAVQKPGRNDDQFKLLGLEVLSFQDMPPGKLRY
jgi:hypothetical protein